MENLTVGKNDHRLSIAESIDAESRIAEAMQQEPIAPSLLSHGAVGFSRKNLAAQLVHAETGETYLPETQTTHTAAPRESALASNTRSSDPGVLPKLTVQDGGFEINSSMGKLSIAYGVTPEKRLQATAEKLSETMNNFDSIDTDNDNFLSEGELARAGGFNGALSKYAGMISKNMQDRGDGKVSMMDLKTLKVITGRGDIRLGFEAAGTMVGTTPGLIGLGSVLLTCSVELGYMAAFQVPMGGKFRTVGLGLAACAIAYGYYKQQEHLSSLKAQIAQDKDLNPYCTAGQLNIENNLFRLNLNPKSK